MLTLTVAGKELWDEAKSEFTYTKDTTIQLEHSLISLSRWESTWCKPFLVQDGKHTQEEIISYIQCMTMTQNVDPKVYASLTREDIDKVMAYIDDPHTATWFNDKNKGRRGNPSGETLTSEYIYYLMIQQGVPFECEKWHLNRLMTLLRVCSVKNSNGGKKMSQQDTLRNYAQLNAMRRAKMPHK